MASANYTIEVKLRHAWLLYALLYMMRFIPKSRAYAILNYPPFINCFIYIEKSRG